jgi:hypothetical protein
MDIELDEQALPFLIPERLRHILKSNPAEYGTGGEIGTVLPCRRAWIVRCGSRVVGFAWVRVDGSEGEEQLNYFSQAVLVEERDQGVGQRVRDMVEGELRAAGIAHLYVQVNNNEAGMGLRVRSRLLGSGYVVDRTRIMQKYFRRGAKPLDEIDDQELIRTYFMPVHFRKSLL